MAGSKLSPREMRRYSRQIMIPEIGVAGQEKLKQAKVLVVGAGGLGCPILQYLVVAGVGKIGIAEFDKVDEANLQRQVLYGSNDVGKLKSIIAKNRMLQLNSLADIEIFNLRIESTNAEEIFRNFDIIVDATDNFKTRYAIDDACALHNKPMVHGAIYKYEGQVSIFNYKESTSYRNYNPKAMTDHFKNPLAADVGLMGVLPGITGTYMANEVIKIITGSGDVLAGKILLLNIFNNTFHVINIKKNL